MELPAILSVKEYHFFFMLVFMRRLIDGKRYWD